jgi:hypothetical protein
LKLSKQKRVVILQIRQSRGSQTNDHRSISVPRRRGDHHHRYDILHGRFSAGGQYGLGSNQSVADVGSKGGAQEYRAGIGNDVRNLLKIDGIDSRVTATDGVGLMMDMTCRIVRVNNNTICVGDIEMKNPGFPVVDPDDRMIVHGHKCSFRVAVAQPA